MGFALRPRLTLLTLYCKWAGAELEQAHALDGVVRGHVERGELLHLGGGHRPRCPHRFHVFQHVVGIHLIQRTVKDVRGSESIVSTIRVKCNGT